MKTTKEKLSELRLKAERWRRLHAEYSASILVRDVISLLDDLDEAEARAERYREALQPLIDIANAYDSNSLDDEARKRWGRNEEHVNMRDPKTIELYTGRGGKRLLTLADCLAACAALAETANKTESRGIPRTNDDGERRGNIHPEPGTSSPDDAERAAREWYLAHHDRWADSDNVKSLVALLRTRDAQAHEAGRVEGWREAVAECARLVSAHAIAVPQSYAVTIDTLGDVERDIRALKRPDRAKGGGER